MTKKDVIAERLRVLRKEIDREHLLAYIFTTASPHGKQPVADHWKAVEWATGCDLPTALVVVTMTKATLWTNSQLLATAEEQLKDTEFQMMRLDEDSTVAAWLGEECAASSFASTEVAIDGSCWSMRSVRELIADLRRHGGMTLRTNFDPLQRVWPERPSMPTIALERTIANEDAKEKLSRLRKALRQEHADGMLMTDIDDMAWTLNLIGRDAEGKPAFVAFLLVASSTATLFVPQQQLSQQLVDYLDMQGVSIAPYEKIKEGLKAYFEYNILIDPDEVSYNLFKSITRIVVEAPSPVNGLR